MVPLSPLPDKAWPDLQRQRRALLVADVVESVRLMLDDEAGQIERWRRFVDEVQRQVLPATGGRLVKSLGDGFLLEFDTVPQAVKASLDMQGLAQAEAPMQLRIGIHAADVVVDELDLWGTGVNLVSRVATLAGPGEIVVTSEARDQLWAGLDAEIEDLGDCYLKHFSEPVRVYRLGPAGAKPVMEPAAAAALLPPTVAVIPFDCEAQPVIGELLADAVIAQLSLSADLRVLSRLSCAAFARRTRLAQEIGSTLGAGYIVSGSIMVLGERLLLGVELCESRQGSVLWAERRHGELSDLLRRDSDLVGQVAGPVHQAILQREVERARSLPLPSLESCTLLFGALNLMHRQSRSDFDRSRQLLEHLAERHGRSATPRAWLGKWYALAAAQGWSEDPQRDAAQARHTVDQALAREPSNALAWAVKGLLEAYVDADFQAASLAYEQALANNPNESLAWLFLSTLQAWRGEQSAAAESAERALQLSPLDPMKYYYDSLAGAAMLGARRYERAIELSLRSARSNRAHHSTFRVLAMAQMLGGKGQEARGTISDLLQRDPGFTLKTFLRNSPWRFSPDVDLLVEALREAGVPQG